MKKCEILFLFLFSLCISCSENDNGNLTDILTPTITTKPVADISFNGVITGGIITNQGGGEILEKGIVISTTPNPTIGSSTKKISNSNGNDFEVIFNNLEPNTTYNVRAYSKNSAGIGYGENVSFTTTEIVSPGNGMVDIEGNNYQSLIYNGYEWTIKNLDVTTYRNGDIIPQVQEAAEWANLTSGAWCYYENNTENGTIYGKLYNWYAVNDPRGLAPEGWHIANDGEFYRLQEFLIDNEFNCYETSTNRIAKSLASDILWQSTGVSPTTCSPLSGSLDDNNSSGFNALPSGFRDSTGEFNFITGATRWWTTTEGNDEYVDFRDLVGHIGEGLRQGGALKTSGMAVRCVKDLGDE